MLILFKNLSIAKKFFIVGIGFLAASGFSIWGMSEIAKTSLLQKLERDHIELTTLLYFKAQNYSQLVNENLSNASLKAETVLNARSQDNKEKGIRQLMEDMRQLQDNVFMVTNSFERTLFRWFGFGRAFELAGKDGPEHDRAIKTYLEQLEKKELTPAQFEKKFINEVVTISAKSGEFAPIVRNAGIFVRNLMIGLTITFLISEIAILMLVLTPMNRLIKHLTEVSKEIAEGSLEKNIEIDQKDEIGQLAEAFRRMQQQISEVLRQAEAITQKILEGKLDSRINVDSFSGGWKDMVMGINALIEAFVKPIHLTAAYIDRISSGSLPEEITEEFTGDFNQIKTNLNRCIDVVNGLVAETVMLTENAADGKLDVRGNPDKFQGDYARIIGGINHTIDALVKPMKVAGFYIKRISQGDSPETITELYKGDFNEIKISLNMLIDAMNETVHIAENIAAGNLDGRRDGAF